MQVKELQSRQKGDKTVFRSFSASGTGLTEEEGRSDFYPLSLHLTAVLPTHVAVYLHVSQGLGVGYLSGIKVDCWRGWEDKLPDSFANSLSDMNRVFPLFLKAPPPSNQGNLSILPGCLVPIDSGILKSIMGLLSSCVDFIVMPSRSWDNLLIFFSSIVAGNILLKQKLKNLIWMWEVRPQMKQLRNTEISRKMIRFNTVSQGSSSHWIWPKANFLVQLEVPLWVKPTRNS